MMAIAVIAQVGGQIALALTAVTFLLFTGVVLPAVWSRRHARRSAARAVLRLLLDGSRRQQ